MSVPQFMPIFSAAGSGVSPAIAAGAELAAMQTTRTPIPSPGVAAASSYSIPGFAAVPAKLVRKIWALEYVDMWELLPESWRLETAERGCCQAKRTRRGLVTDIFRWTECFTTLAATLSVRYPQSAPQLMAYLRTIVRASRNFEGSAWATYDAAYRRQAANNRRLDWATPDPALYNEAFTGRAKAIPRCLTATRAKNAYMPQRRQSPRACGSSPPGREWAQCQLPRSAAYSTAQGEHVPFQAMPLCTPMC